MRKKHRCVLKAQVRKPQTCLKRNRFCTRFLGSSGKQRRTHLRAVVSQNAAIDSWSVWRESEPSPPFLILTMILAFGVGVVLRLEYADC